jgi:hypothetical protein
MKITIADKFWVVLDPTHLSVIEDIFFEATLPVLELMIMGNAMVQKCMTHRNLTIHTVELSAREDAEARLATRG